MNKPFIEACRTGNLEKVKKLLNRHFLRPDVNCRTERGSGPLSFAAYNGYKEIVNTLLMFRR